VTEGLAVLGGWLELAVLLAALAWVVRRRANREHEDAERDTAAGRD
jgi:hypothetical protein